MTYGYAHEKLQTTLNGIVGGSGSLRSRLTHSWQDQGHRLSGGPNKLGPLKARYDKIHDAMTASGTIEKSVAAMSDDEVRQMAIRILELSTEVAEAYGAENAQDVLADLGR